MDNLMYAVPALLAAKPPSGLTGSISNFLGAIMDFLFNISYAIFPGTGALALSIILLTIVVRIAMIPMGMKSQQSMAATQRLAPKVNEIKKKYGDTKDPEQTRKMNVEIQNLYSKNGANPITGCLPLLITLPLFIALSTTLRNSHFYIAHLSDLYNQIPGALISAMESAAGFKEKIDPLILSKWVGKDFNLYNPEYIKAFISQCSPKDLADIRGFLPDSSFALYGLIGQKLSVESLFGINLTGSSGWGFPGIFIPIATGLSTFLTSLISMRQTRNMDKTQAQTQKMMMFGMPIMMIVMTTSVASGVGLYWIVSSLFQAGQQFVLHKYYTDEKLDSIMAKKNAKREARAERVRLKK